MRECATCAGEGVVPDPSACDDPEHCDPMLSCPDCSGTGWQEQN